MCSGTAENQRASTVDDAGELSLASIRPLTRSGYSGSLRSTSRSDGLPSVFPPIRTKQSHIPLARDRTQGHTDETFLPMHAIFTGRPPPRCRQGDALACLPGVRCGGGCGMPPIACAATRRRKNDACLKHFRHSIAHKNRRLTQRPAPYGFAPHGTGIAMRSVPLEPPATGQKNVSRERHATTSKLRGSDRAAG